MLSPTGRWVVSVCILVSSAVHFVSLLFWYDLGDGGGDGDGSSPTPGASRGWNVTQVERRLAQMTLYTCGWDQGVLAARLFPDYRPVGRLDNSPEPPTNHSVLVMGKFGPCRKSSTDFPGHVLTIDGEGGALLSTEPKMPTGGPVPGFFGAIALIGHYPEMTDALFHPEKKVVNTGERFLLYIALNCVGYREEAFDRLAAAGATHERYNRNQLILGRQFIEVGGADVNAKANPGMLSCFPLFNACDSRVCLNLNFIRLLLENGADPNQQNARGETPLMNALDCSIPAAKLLLTFEHENAVPINVNIRAFDGRTVLGMLNESFLNLTQGLMHQLHMISTGERRHSLDKVKYLLAQVVELRSLLDKRGAVAGERIETELPIITAEIEEAKEEGWKERGLFATPLEYDGRCLFGKDLQRDANVPEWQKDIWIDDLESIQFEVHERKDHLHSNRSRGGGRSPEVGLRIKLKVRLPNKSKGILDGKLVDVLPAPTDADMRRNQSSLLGTKCPCNDPECKRTKTGKRKDIVAKHGALHGQEVKGVVKLAKSMRGDKSLAAFFGADTKYEITLRCKDIFPNMWFLARIGPHQSRSS